MIYEIKMFCNEKGAVVTGKFPTDGTNPTFMGEGIERLQGQSRRFQFVFPDHMDTLEKCFENYAAVGQEAYQKSKEEQQKKDLIIPAKTLPPNLQESK